jgi:hypothetical protein
MIHPATTPEPEETDEFSPEIIKENLRKYQLDQIETNCVGNCYSDADPGL